MMFVKGKLWKTVQWTRTQNVPEIYRFTQNRTRLKKVVPRPARTEFLTYPNFKGRGNRPEPNRFWFEWHIDRNRIFHCVTPNSKKGLLNKRHIIFCCGRWVAGDNKRGPKRRPPEQTGYVLNFSVPHPFENTLFLGVQHRPKRHLGLKSGSFQVLEGGLGGLTSTQCIF